MGSDTSKVTEVSAVAEQDFVRVKFQDGPVGVAGANGCLVEDVIEVALARLRALNAEQPCRENSLAVTALEDAQNWLWRRTRDRRARSVEVRVSKSQLIYVSGPLTGASDEVERRNVEAAMAVGAALWARGHRPVVPHLSHWWDLALRARGQRVPWEQWLDLDVDLLRRCDALFRIAASRGADVELFVARSHNLAVYTSLDEVPVIGEGEPRVGEVGQEWGAGARRSMREWASEARALASLERTVAGGSG